MIALLLLLVAAAPAALVSCGGSAQPEAGSWRAWLDTPGGELPFGLLFETAPGGFTAAIMNGEESIPIPVCESEGDSIFLLMPHYDSAIRARLSGGELEGEWRLLRRGGVEARLPFHAILGSTHRFIPSEEEEGGLLPRRWSVDFADDDPAVAIFESGPEGSLTGTFLTPTGDYRYLSGDWRGERLRLSCFDGAHAFLFVAERRADGILEGDFWSGGHWHDRWTARPDANAALPDAFAQSRWVNEVDWRALKFPDLEGEDVALGKLAQRGKANILYLFGTWCPNCHDASELLVRLQEHYGNRGLAITGLAFEHTDELARSIRQLERYRQRHQIEFPLLVAGHSDKARASEAFPALDRLRSYPTTVFLDATGAVRAVHSGFLGPATGVEGERTELRFVQLIEGLLDE